MNKFFQFTFLLIFIFLIFPSISNGKDTIKLITNSPIEKKKPNENCDTKICISLLSLINNAKKTIDFAIYGLRGQNEILQALIKAEKREVKVRGVVDKDVKGKNYYADTHLLNKSLKYIHDDYKFDIKTREILKKKKKKYKSKNKKCQTPPNTKGPVQCFEGKGYASKDKIKFKGDIMHNKFFIVDGRYVWTGSANISDTGIGGYNANIVVFAESEFLSRYYTLEFEQMFIDGEYHRRKSKLKKQDISTIIDGSEVSLFFSPQGYAVDRGIIPLIQQSKDTIDVAIFFLTHKNITKELVNARKRGVKVRIILDATAATNGYSKHNYLREKGIDVKVESWGGKMHMKSAVIDKKNIIVGSMNWTGAGESKNDENTIIIQNSSKLGVQLSSFFQELWTSIPEKWLRHDPLPESIDSGTSCYDLIDNDFDGIKDSSEKECVE